MKDGHSTKVLAGMALFAAFTVLAIICCNRDSPSTDAHVIYLRPTADGLAGSFGEGCIAMHFFNHAGVRYIRIDLTDASGTPRPPQAGVKVHIEATTPSGMRARIPFRAAGNALISTVPVPMLADRSTLVNDAVGRSHRLALDGHAPIATPSLRPARAASRDQQRARSYGTAVRNAYRSTTMSGHLKLDVRSHGLLLPSCKLRGWRAV